MAQYKVPQDVEADDKLIGPFSFRQFVYLLIAAGLIALAVGLFQIFPALAIIPVPFVLFFAALALPLKKDQPMETYLAAVISYYLKPHNRVWTPGQKESTIVITAPKVVEESRTRDITGEEATHRLSFLADVVDSEGRIISDGMGAGNRVRDDLIDEANSTNDMFETGHFNALENTIARDENVQRAEVIKEMREAINRESDLNGAKVETSKQPVEDATPSVPISLEPSEEIVEKAKNETRNEETESPKPSIIELANNNDFSIATIAKEAKRINKKKEGEVFISLH